MFVDVFCCELRLSLTMMSLQSHMRTTHNTKKAQLIQGLRATAVCIKAPRE